MESRVKISECTAVKGELSVGPTSVTAAVVFNEPAGQVTASSCFSLFGRRER